MTGIDLFNAITEIDEDIIDRANEKEKTPEKRSRRVLIVSVAAVLAIAATATAVLNLLDNDGETPDAPTYTIPLVREQIRSASPTYYGDENSAGGSGFAEAELIGSGISVTAELIEVLPDIYTFFDDWKQIEYRLLRMSAVSLLKGAEMTDEFYYLIPAAFMTDLSRYDRFVILDMAQFGYDHSVLFNKTNGKAEALSLALFGYGVYGRDGMGEKFMAFDKDGKFDGSLWKSNYSWAAQTGNAEPPADISEAENNAKRDNYGKELYVHLLRGIKGEAYEKLTELRSFDNGIFVPTFSTYILHFSPEVQFHAVRYINGFATNEQVSICSGDVSGNGGGTFSETKARFTEDDLSSLPDLHAAVISVAKEFDKGSIKPPHITDADRLPGMTYGIFGWYAKTEDGVVGIVRVTWRYRSGEADDAYYIIDKSSEEVRTIDRDDLLELLGKYETTYIFTGPYNEGGKVLGETAS